MRLRFLLGLAAVLAIAGGSVMGALIVRDHEHDAFHRNQRQQAVRAANQAEAVAALSVGQLATAAAFFQAEEEVTSHEFDILADSLLESGGLVATAFVERVPHSERSSYERRRGFQIIERRSFLGDFQRADVRPDYFPLAFAATAEDIGVRFPLGYNMSADPERARFLLRARDSGDAATTRVIRLSLGGTGINVFRPVYADGEPTATVRQRRAALVGFATAAFRIEDLVRAATDSLSEEFEAQLLERDRPVAGGPLAREDAATAPLRIADRRWLLVVRDPNHPALTLPALMAILGISLAALMGALVLVWSRNERMQELQHQASEDPLTGLKNRRRFEEDLRIELARGRRDGSTGALLLLDIDDFKRVNDSSGHPAGDRALQEVASTLRRRTRETDVLARVGGDEFAVVLPHCSTDDAGAVAEAIADAIREQRPPEDGTHPLTVSIGLAMFGADPRTDFESVQSFADTGMYAAKGAGGDQVKVVTPGAGAAEHHAGSGEPA